MPKAKETHKTFMTFDQDGASKTWTYSSPKQGGANDAGKYGGFYQSGVNRCLIKQDIKIPLNIAEFLAGKIYKAMIPEVSAEIKLARVNDDEEISTDGRNVYLVSEFIPGWKSDLYTEIQLSLNRSPERSKFKYKETWEVAGQLLFCPREINKFFQVAQKNGDLLNFGQVSATSLLLNNTDTNLGNLGVINRHGEQKKLGVIDYGVAFRNMTPKINPHSFRKYLSTHTYNHEGWNNFMFYPESIKVTPEFVCELDKASQKDLTEVVTNAFQEISSYYGIKPIIEFAVRAGVSQQYTDRLLTEIEKNPQLVLRKIEQIKEAIIEALQQRQADLSRFSLQIKMDLCVQLERSSNRFKLNGSFVNTSGKKVTFNDVVFDHFNYFKEILLEEEQFKFRKSTHKRQPKLIDNVKSKCIIIYACFILVDQNKEIRTNYNINTMDDAISALQEGRLDKNTLDKVLNNDFIVSAREKLSEYEIDKKQLKLASVLQIMADLNICLDEQDDAYKRLEGNSELQEAILKLDKGCTHLSTAYTPKEHDAILVYKTNTITLALKGAKNFKENYASIEAQVIQDIDHIEFIKFVRIVGNLLVLALATASVLGMCALAITSRQRGGLLLFKGPERDLSNIVSKFDDLQDNDNVSEAQPF